MSRRRCQSAVARCAPTAVASSRCTMPLLRAASKSIGDHYRLSTAPKRDRKRILGYSDNISSHSTQRSSAFGALLRVKVLPCYDFRTRSARPSTSDVVLSKIGSESAETGVVKIGRSWAAGTDRVVIPSLLSAVGDFEPPYLLESNSVATICASAVNNLTGA